MKIPVLVYGLIDKLVTFWQSRCNHNRNHVTSDILEGMAEELTIRWCRRCGAVRVIDDGNEWDWREPRASWWTGSRKEER